MILEPSAVILYVDDLAKSCQFYQDLLGLKPQTLSPSFSQFTLSYGLNLGLKVKRIFALVLDKFTLQLFEN
jgi:catechol 2,3-dioxygenase-like lactoylglutathione lyase family enzyme